MSKTFVFSALALLLAAGCASNASMASSSVPGLEIHLAQANAPTNMYYFRGPVNVQYQLQITNPTSQTLKLRQINLQTMGAGAYRLRTGDSPMNYTIPPNSTITLPLSAWAYASGGFLQSGEPVSIRGLAYIDWPNGSFVRQFTEYIPQQ